MKPRNCPNEKHTARRMRREVRMNMYDPIDSLPIHSTHSMADPLFAFMHVLRCTLDGCTNARAHKFTETRALRSAVGRNA